MTTTMTATDETERQNHNRNRRTSERFTLLSTHGLRIGVWQEALFSITISFPILSTSRISFASAPIKKGTGHFLIRGFSGRHSSCFLLLFNLVSFHARLGTLERYIRS
jgi:hypothetical protein